MNADGSGQRNLTRNKATDGGSSWSPDVRKIAFGSLRDGNSEVYVMNADGSGQRNLTRNKAEDFAAAWSPTSSRTR
jgi:Tol biopolymer transport system component